MGKPKTEESELTAVVRKNIADYEILDDVISDRVMARLCDIEKYAQSCEAQYEQGRHLLDSSNLTVQAVAQGIGVSRAALYKTEYFRMYIEKRTEGIKRKYFGNDAILEENRILRIKLGDSAKRDARIVALKAKVQQLEEEAGRNSYYAENIRLSAENSKLLHKCDELQSQLNALRAEQNQRNTSLS